MDSKGIKTTYTLIECIAHYLSTAFNWLDPEVAVSFYRKNSIVLQKNTITPIPELRDPLFIHKIWLTSPIEENSPICLTDFSSHL